MHYEVAYLYLEHLFVMLEHGNIAGLQMDRPEERQFYADAVKTALPLLELHGVKVDNFNPRPRAAGDYGRQTEQGVLPSRWASISEL